ncbi:MAG: hypothetical protein CTY37_05315 [Methylotenera sp.]|nr:MAG: hypothetical protein CTY37_05315 [Methylotenera sp.]
MLHQWQCKQCRQSNLGHSTICAHCPSTQKQLLDEAIKLLKRHIERKENGAPQHKHTYQDFKNLMQKYELVKGL